MSAAATSVTLVLSIDQLDAIHPNAVPCCAGSWGLFLGTCQRCSPKVFILTFLLQFLSLQIFSMSPQKRSKLSANDNWQKMCTLPKLGNNNWPCTEIYQFRTMCPRPKFTNTLSIVLKSFILQRWCVRSHETVSNPPNPPSMYNWV